MIKKKEIEEVEIDVKIEEVVVAMKIIIIIIITTIIMKIEVVVTEENSSNNNNSINNNINRKMRILTRTTRIAIIMRKVATVSG